MASPDEFDPTLPQLEGFAAAKPGADDAVDPFERQRVIAAVLGDDGALPRIDRFIVERRLGSGGMGVVYQAKDPEADGKVAIKVLDRRSESDVERFAREAQILAKLEHPAIVGYVTHGVTAAGHPYLVMEWLDGRDLATRLKDGGLTIDQTVQLGVRLAEALACAHRHGIVHRDLKPANVFLPDDRLDDAKLLDFGVAREEPDSRSDRHLPPALTKTGMLVGTPAYMAPEQIHGNTRVDARSDLFSLGVTLYECLVGRPVFQADHLLGVLARVLFQEPPVLSDLRSEVPSELSILIRELLAKDPADRPAHAELVAERLGRLGHVPGGAPIPITRPPRLSAGELQVVSLLLIDHRGSVAPLRPLAEEYGARLERVTSDTLVAVPSGSGPAVDLVASAARLALALCARHPETPVAVATGRGELRSGVPIGDAIDRGVRLLEGKAPGVRLDETSGALLAGRFELEWSPDHALLAGLRPLEAPTRTLLGRALPCVGRERELALLDAVLTDATSGPAARAALVTAPAGVGKSRLAHEWRRRVSARPNPPRVLFARGEPVSAGTPYYLGAQLVRRGSGLREQDPPALQRAMLARHLETIGFETAERERLECFLAELLGLGSEGDAVSEELSIARKNPLLMGDILRVIWEDWLLLECRRGPLLIVAEDLHWADAPSIRLLDGALRALAEQPVMLLALARPEVRERFQNLWANRGVREVHLGELSSADSEALIRAALGNEADATTIAWICERAGGHALYLEETIRAVTEGRREGAPATVLAMVQARLSSLPTESRLVLRAASIFGEIFWRGSIAELTGRDESEVAAILDELVERETVFPRRQSRFAGEAEYGFRHHLFREAAASMLTAADCALGHRLAADWLLAAGERQPSVLADHLERGDDRARAIEWHLRAADEALLGNDFDAALERVARGMALGAESATLGRLLLIESEARIWRSNDGSGATVALKARDSLPPRSAHWYDALRCAVAARMPASRELLSEVKQLLEETPLDPSAHHSYVMALVVASEHLSFRGEHRESLEFVARAERLAAQKSNGDQVRGWTQRARGSALLFAGKHDQALTAYLAAAAWFEQHGHRREVCSVGNTIGWLQATELGLHHEAVPTLEKTLAFAEELGLPGVASSAKQNLAVALMHLGRAKEARRLLEETVLEFERSGDVRRGAGSRFYLTLLHTTEGELATAEEQALIALKVADGVPTTTACTLAAYARALVAMGRHEEALERARAAARILADLGGIEEGESLINLGLAEALHANGAGDEAQRTISSAKERLEARAEAMTDGRVREAFLHRVPEHQQTLELFRAWGGA